MKRKATYKVTVTRREMLHVGDVPDHTLMLTELEGEPVEYQVGVAGEFTTFEEGQVYSRFEGHRDAQTKLTTGTWKTYKGVGKLKNVKGQGNFTVKPADQPGEFLLDIEGDYEL
ncbi:MAG: hypothetical protein JRI66_10310 [Deltaproteobacteria bacterium]|nr:hypothetical protein [Deltaproteobacteria bacterium]